jgi:hypothetical protein
MSINFESKSIPQLAVLRSKEILKLENIQIKLAESIEKLKIIDIATANKFALLTNTGSESKSTIRTRKSPSNKISKVIYRQVLIDNNILFTQKNTIPELTEIININNLNNYLIHLITPNEDTLSTSISEAEITN